MNAIPDFSRYRDIIDDFEAFEAALARPLPLCVWANDLKITPAELEASFGSHGIDFQPRSWRPGTYLLDPALSPGTRFEYAAGLYHVQEEVSLLPVTVLDPQPGERLLDTCAAPGNKTAQIAVAMQNTGTLIANDRDYRRMRAVSRVLDRLGVFNASLICHDAANLPADLGSFDRILADVPCSCEGTSRKNPRVGAARPAELSRMSRVQQAILKRALDLCRPGGLIAYATCTYAPEENEAVIHACLNDPELGDFDVLPTRIPGFHSAPGLIEWQGESFDPRLKNAMRVYPHHNDSGGFFVALLQKGARS
ncbi:RsmB/NOP family class I SAM-dependent RNA methyltransferase [Lujinxingia vulgaris]|uniref:RsmB/NOP family class I SAM-dependent RNA methyltransferase n=1 Tax=Lujinxingia vulgaris TaxID=2600176 RepID=A0A5C6XB55_9DELT|nr:RsmB/NOP family class I SAM-dependent RNA methyltransferase [Lujinxingia vulgaris]TXD38576.1 RsmB/NOP family class I SAM-dependent RNA methyltransferase [Lujinxingia vulgaris]